MTDIVILDGARTAIGTFGGALAGTPPIELGTVAAKAALERSGVEGAQIGHVVFGHVINTEPRDMYVSRAIAIEAGASETTPALTVNRLCGSGLQAILNGIQTLALGDADTVLAGGIRQLARVDLDLHRGAGNGGGAGFRDHTQRALRLGQGALDQDHCADFGAVGEQAANLGGGKQARVHRAVKDGTGHQSVLSMRSSTPASPAGSDRNGECDVGMV